jgi:Fic family protein
MKPGDFHESQRQFLHRTVDSAWAFVPPPLPPNFYNEEIAMPLAAAASAIGELKGAARRLQNPSMLIEPLQRREALTSSAMEGTITTLGDMVIEEATHGFPNNDNARETTNYVRAVTAACQMLTSIPLSHRVIKEAHAQLLSGLSPSRGAGKRPGEYKIHQNAVGKRGENINTARYVPPPPPQTQVCMDALEAYINREGQGGPGRLVDLALIHYQFEAIHPFDDGNGRIGRMLITLMAIQSGLLDHPLLHMSAQLERDKDEYVDQLFNVSTHGHWERWIIYFLEAVEASCRDAIRLVDRILELQTNFRNRASQASRNPRLLMIVDALFTKTWTTAREAQELCSVSFPTAQSDLDIMVRTGLLQVLGGGRPKLYYSPELLLLSDRT